MIGSPASGGAAASPGGPGCFGAHVPRVSAGPGAVSAVRAAMAAKVSRIPMPAPVSLPVRLFVHQVWKEMAIFGLTPPIRVPFRENPSYTTALPGGRFIGSRTDTVSYCAHANRGLGPGFL